MPITDDKKEISGWPLVGNERVGKFLQASVKRGKISGTYIFNGPEDLGKFTAARFFAQMLLCPNSSKPGAQLPCGYCPSCRKLDAGPSYGQGIEKLASADDPVLKKKEEEKNKIDLSGGHGDLFILKRNPEKKYITVEDTREFIRMLAMGSFLGSWKAGIVKDADYLNSEAANALLKTLEEPKQKTVIILTVADIDRLLPTIISRSQRINFFPVETVSIYDFLVRQKAARSAAKNLSRLSLGRPALAIKFFREKEYHRQYLEIAGAFFQLAGFNLNRRLDLAGGLLDKKLTGQAAVGAAGRVIDIWESAARDLVLYETGQKNLIRNEALSAEIETAGRHLGQERVINFLAGVKTAREYLKANVSPRTILEEMAINL